MNLEQKDWPKIEREVFDFYFSLAKKYGIDWTGPAAIYFCECALNHSEGAERERIVRAVLMMIEDTAQ